MKGGITASVAAGVADEAGEKGDAGVTKLGFGLTVGNATVGAEVNCPDGMRLTSVD